MRTPNRPLRLLSLPASSGKATGAPGPPWASIQSSLNGLEGQSTSSSKASPSSPVQVSPVQVDDWKEQVNTGRYVTSSLLRRKSLEKGQLCGSFIHRRQRSIPAGTKRPVNPKTNRHWTPGQPHLVDQLFPPGTDNPISY